MTELDALLRQYDAGIASDIALPWNEYRVVSCLRHDGSERVLVVADGSDTRYILKMADGAKGMALEREYQALSNLRHPCFPRAVAFAWHDGQACFLREYIAGKTLAAYAGEQPLSVREILCFGQEVCDILNILHAQTPPVIHRDIKPQNFIVTPRRRLVLVDFDSVQNHDPSKHQDTLFIGTPNTAAPEQFGAGRSGFATDVYGIGKLLLYLIANDTDIACLRRSRVPVWLKRVVRRATAFDPTRRYPTVNKLLKALLRVQRWPFRIALACLALLCYSVALAIPAMAPQTETTIPPAFEQQESLPIDENAPVKFKEPLIEKAAAYVLGKDIGSITRNDLRSVTRLLICGDTPYDEWDQATSYGKNNTVFFDREPKGRLPENDGDIVSLDDLRLMPNLRELSLYRQRIEDISPLEGLPLRRLALAANPIRDFSVLATMTRLTHLDVSATRFVDTTLLTGCTKLESFRMMESFVYDLSPLEGLPIRELYLYYENVADDCSVLLRFPELSCLKIHLVPAADLEIIGRLKSLEMLDLDRCSGSSLEPLSGLASLRYLFLGNTSVSSLEGIQNLRRLETLSVNGSPVHDLSPLLDLEHLAHLEISGVALDDETQLMRLEHLEELGVSPGQVKRLQAMGLPYKVYAVTF